MEDTVTYKETETTVTETTKTVTLKDVIDLVVNKVRNKVDGLAVYEDEPCIYSDDYGDEVTIRIDGYRVDVYGLFEGMSDGILDEMTNTKRFETKEETVDETV